MKTINDLFSLAIDHNDNDLHLFVNFSGHTDYIEINIHYAGWKKYTKLENIAILRINVKDQFEVHKAFIQLVRAIRFWKKKRVKTYFDFDNHVKKFEK